MSVCTSMLYCTNSCLFVDIETWSVSNIDDTWLLVLVASSIGVLLLGALLAMFLLKCREYVSLCIIFFVKYSLGVSVIVGRNFGRAFFRRHLISVKLKYLMELFLNYRPTNETTK